MNWGICACEDIVKMVCLVKFRVYLGSNVEKSEHFGLLTTSRIPSLFSAASLGARVQEKTRWEVNTSPNHQKSNSQFIFIFFSLLQTSSQYREDVFSVAQRNKETRQTNGDRYKLFQLCLGRLISWRVERLKVDVLGSTSATILFPDMKKFALPIGSLVSSVRRTNGYQVHNWYTMHGMRLFVNTLVGSLIRL